MFPQKDDKAMNNSSLLVTLRVHSCFFFFLFIAISCSHTFFFCAMALLFLRTQRYFLGERNGFDKRYMWDESIRAPCVLRYPRKIAPNTLLPSGFLLQHVDWAPTLLELAQVDVQMLPRLLSSSKRGHKASKTKSSIPYASTAPLSPSPNTQDRDKDEGDGKSLRNGGENTRTARMSTSFSSAPSVPTVGFHGRSFAHLVLAQDQMYTLKSSSRQPIEKRWARDAIYYRFYGTKSASSTLMDEHMHILGLKKQALLATSN